MPSEVKVELSKKEVLAALMRAAVLKHPEQLRNVRHAVREVRIGLAGPDGSLAMYMGRWYIGKNDRGEYWDKLGARVSFTLPEPPEPEEPEDALRAECADDPACGQDAGESGETSP